MDPHEISHAKRPGIGAALMWIGGIGAVIVGVAISTGLHAALPFTFGTGTTGLGVVAGVFPFLLLFVLGCLLA
jgi:energy-coupling factor transport system substrate-specific component